MMSKFKIAIAALAATAQAVPRPLDGRTVLERPAISPFPYTPAKAFAASPARDLDKLCFVEASCSGGDDAPAILSGLHRCNHGGTIVLDADYTVASPLDLTFLDSVDVIFTGKITFTDDIEYWSANTFKYAYQNVSTFWRWGGHDVNIYGGGMGTLEGQGQIWWDTAAVNKTLERPVLLVIDGLHGGTISGINLHQTPFWNSIIANSSNVVMDGLYIHTLSNSSHPAANSDGLDTYRSDNIVIQNWEVYNDDDCIAFKPNSTNIVVQNINCTGSHGISVGSLGQYLGEVDIVENITVYNINMTDASDGARIKVWPGIPSLFQPLLNGGGGLGYVKNVTYDTIHNHGTTWAIELTQCYGSSNQTLCTDHPSNLTMSDIVFKNFDGETSAAKDPYVGTLVCSDPTRCSNIQAYNIDVSPPSGAVAEWVCTNMDDALLHVNCVPSASSKA